MHLEHLDEYLNASHVQTFLLFSFFLTMDVVELTSKLAVELTLPEDSSPIQIINKGLRKLGVRQGDLTPDSAEAVNFVDWQGQIQRGDHLIARDADGVIEHHGIFLGRLDAITKVADFWGEDKESARIRIRPLFHFVSGKAQLLVVRYNWDEKDTAWRDLSAELAIALAKEGHPQPLYNFLSHNCDHFATFCRTFRYVTKRATVSFHRLPMPHRSMK